MIIWISASKEQAHQWLHDGPYPGALGFMAKQLINSDPQSTREFWRERIRIPAELMGDYVIPSEDSMEARK